MHRTVEDYPRRVRGTTIGFPVPNWLKNQGSMTFLRRRSGCRESPSSSPRRGFPVPPGPGATAPALASPKPVDPTACAAAAEVVRRCSSIAPAHAAQNRTALPHAGLQNSRFGFDGRHAESSQRRSAAVRRSTPSFPRLQIACHSGMSIKSLEFNGLNDGADGVRRPWAAAVSKLTQSRCARLQRDPPSSASTVSIAGSTPVASTWVRSS